MTRGAPSPAKLRLLDFARVAVLALAVWWIYAPALHGDWLWDDNSEITTNRELRDPAGWWHAWVAPAGPDYFPLKTDVQWLQWRAWGGASTLGYHLANVALHLASALLAWRILRRLGLRFAWLGGLLFAVHPIAVESVAWIAELKNALSLPLLLLAFDAWLDFEERAVRSAYVRAWLWFLAALLSKSSVVMFPVVLGLLAWWKRGRISRLDAVRLAPFYLFSLLLGLVTISFQRRAMSGWQPPESGVLECVANAGRAFAFYLGKCLWPDALAPIYTRWSEGNALAAGVAAWLAIAAMVVVCWRARATWGRHALLGLGFFGINLVPVLGLVPMSYQHIAPVADHFAYVSLLGVTGLVVAVGETLASRGEPTRRWALSLALSGAAGALAITSRSYAAAFAGPEALWTLAIERNPQAWLARNNLGALRLKQERWAEAATQLEAAIRFWPYDAPAHTNLGSALAHLGRLDEALAQQREAVRLEPDSADAHFNLANTFAITGRLDEAIAHYRAAVRVAPGLPDVRHNFANTLVRAGRLSEAMAQYREALRLQPNSFESELNLGNALAAAGQMREAADHFEAAARLNPDSGEAHYCLADALVELGRASEALAHYETAARLKPDDAELRARLEQVRRQR